jgi:hypothetical protein
MIGLAASAARACPLCENALQVRISAQELIYAENSVLAVPTSDGTAFRVVAVIKGGTPKEAVIADPVFKADASLPTPKPLLLLRDDDWRRWVNFGPVSADHADWLRGLSKARRTIGFTDADWHDHLTSFLPYLEHAEPMVAEIAHNEFVSAPYAAYRLLKPQIKAETIREWLKSPNLAARRPLYVLLLGVSGDEKDARWIEQRIFLARELRETSTLPALFAALAELRGPSYVEQRYVADTTRTEIEIDAARMALHVQAGGKRNQALR